MKPHLYLVILLIVLTSCIGDTVKIGYVENYTLYNQFDLTKELEQDLQVFSSQRTNEIDSLSLVLNTLTEELEAMTEIPMERYNEYNSLKNKFAFKQKSYEEELFQKSQQNDSEIWERLNQFIEQYAEENSYDFVLGASGNGSLMYAENSTNITEQLIEFSNSKYNKGE